MNVYCFIVCSCMFTCMVPMVTAKLFVKEYTSLLCKHGWRMYQLRCMIRRTTLSLHEYSPHSFMHFDSNNAVHIFVFNKQYYPVYLNMGKFWWCSAENATHEFKEFPNFPWYDSNIFASSEPDFDSSERLASESYRVASNTSDPSFFAELISNQADRKKLKQKLLYFPTKTIGASSFYDITGVINSVHLQVEHKLLEKICAGKTRDVKASSNRKSSSRYGRGTTKDDRKPLLHGLQYEATAVQIYEEFMYQIGRSIVVQPCALVTSKTHPWLCARPDRKIFDAHERFLPYGLVEVKCPYSFRYADPWSASKDKKFPLELNTSSRLLSVRKTHSVYAQIQGQMAVTGALWCDTIVYTHRGAAVHRVWFDSKYWCHVLKILNTYYFENFIQILME